MGTSTHASGTGATARRGVEIDWLGRSADLCARCAEEPAAGNSTPQGARFRAAMERCAAALGEASNVLKTTPDGRADLCAQTADVCLSAAAACDRAGSDVSHHRDCARACREAARWCIARAMPE